MQTYIYNHISFRHTRALFHTHTHKSNMTLKYALERISIVVACVVTSTHTHTFIYSFYFVCFYVAPHKYRMLPNILHLLKIDGARTREKQEARRQAGGGNCQVYCYRHPETCADVRANWCLLMSHWSWLVSLVYAFIEILFTHPFSCASFSLINAIQILMTNKRIFEKKKNLFESNADGLCVCVCVRLFVPT